MSRWSFDLTEAPPPDAAVEVAARHVSAATIGRRGGQPIVRAYAVEPLPEGAVVPSLTAQNIRDRALVGAAVARALEAVGRPKRIGLVVPDQVAKISLVRFEQVPPRAQDLAQLIRWQVRKAAPFRIEDAQVSWQEAVVLPGGGREYLVTVARRDIIESYERVCDAVGVHAGIIDIASFNQINAVLAGGLVSDDWLLVNVAHDYATLGVVRDGCVVFFRNRTTGGIGDLPDLVHQTAMYHEDRLGGGGFTRVVLAGGSVLGGEATERLRRLLEERIGMRVEPIDFRPAAEMRDRITPSPELLDILAPTVGVLLRDRVARRTPPAASPTERVA